MLPSVQERPHPNIFPLPISLWYFPILLRFGYRVLFMGLPFLDRYLDDRGYPFTNRRKKEHYNQLDDLNFHEGISYSVRYIH